MHRKSFFIQKIRTQFLSVDSSHATRRPATAFEAAALILGPELSCAPELTFTPIGRRFLSIFLFFFLVRVGLLFPSFFLLWRGLDRQDDEEAFFFLLPGSLKMEWIK